MLTFDLRKTKTLSMPVLVEGIDQGQLKFKFVIESNGVEYGFPAEKGGENVKFIIPPLDGVIDNIKDGMLNAKLEVSAITEGDRGFFMLPWAEQIRVKQSVMVSVKPVKEEETPEPVAEKVKLKITSIFTEEDSEPVEEQECVEKEAKKFNKKMRKKFTD